MRVCRSVKKRAGFDITAINPQDFVPRAFTPALFGHARADTFVGVHHTERLHADYAGEKELMLFGDGCDHNSPRPVAFYEAVRVFLSRALHVSPDATPQQEAMLADISRLVPDNHAGALPPCIRASCGLCALVAGCSAQERATCVAQVFSDASQASSEHGIVRERQRERERELW